MLKFIVYIFFPVSLCVIVVGLGVLLLWSTKHKTGKLLVTLGLFFLLLFSNQYFTHVFLGKLEYKFPAILSPEKLELSEPPIRYIVVLGGLPKLHKELPITSKIHGTVLSRLVEGIRLYKALPGTRIILSGGNRAAEVMLEMALALKIPREDIIMETKSANTYEEALYLKETLKKNPFILVTSARHMPRSVALFKHTGLNPIPAPTGHITSPSPKLRLSNLTPSPGSLQRSHEAFYEYMALVKEFIRGRI